MADSLKMGNLSLNESQHAPAGPNPTNGRAAYIPPHLRQRTMGANVDGAAAPPPPGPAAGAWNGPKYVFCNLLYKFQCSPQVPCLCSFWLTVA